MPIPPPAQPTRIVLVDKPGAAQSVITVGQIGAARNSPDFYALSVMNAVLGGQFSSRLNLNLREAKGYTYAARSMFDWRVRQPGPLLASTSVATAVTAPALVELLGEFRGVVGSRPVSRPELVFAKAFLARSYPADFETPEQIALSLETLVEYGLPGDFFGTYMPRIHAVSGEEVSRVAKKYLHADHLVIVIVADRAKVEPALRRLPVGKGLEIVRCDENFRLLKQEQ